MTIPNGIHVLTPAGEGYVVGSDARRGYTVAFHSATGARVTRDFPTVTRKGPGTPEPLADFIARKSDPAYRPLPLPRAPGWPNR